MLTFYALYVNNLFLKFVYIIGLMMAVTAETSSQ